MTDTVAGPVQEKTAYLLETDVVAAQVPALRTCFKELLAGGVKRLNLNLTRVEMVDSAGIGLIISTHNSLRKLGGELELTGVRPEIGDLFRSMRMHQHFKISGAE